MKAYNKCPYCYGIGLQLIEEEAEEYQGKYYTKVDVSIPCPYCNGDKNPITQTTKTSAHIPYNERFDRFKWDFYKEDVSKKRRTAISFVKDFEAWKSEGLGLYIWSKTRGSGKTFLASCICNEIIAQYGKEYEFQPRFISSTDLIDYDKQSSESGIDLIKEFGECQLLVIDDLGQKLTGQGWQEDILFRILDSRMTKHLPTIITSNYSLGEIPLDVRIVDRINRMCQTINLPEDSIRMEESSKMKNEFLKKMGIS